MNKAMAHQNRLDKVLSKFEEQENCYTYKYDLDDEDDLMVYYGNKFWLESINKVISLETVESLIKDLEERK